MTQTHATHSSRQKWRNRIVERGFVVRRHEWRKNTVTQRSRVDSVDHCFCFVFFLFVNLLSIFAETVGGGLAATATAIDVNLVASRGAENKSRDDILHRVHSRFAIITFKVGHQCGLAVSCTTPMARPWELVKK